MKRLELHKYLTIPLLLIKVLPFTQKHMCRQRKFENAYGWTKKRQSDCVRNTLNYLLILTKKSFTRKDLFLVAVVQ